MSTFIVVPRSFTVLANSASTTPTTYLQNDEPGLVWRTTGASSNYVTVQLAAGSLNVISLAGTNLVAGDTIRIRLGNSQASVEGSSAPVDRTATIAAGTPQNGTSFVIDKLSSPVTYTFARIDFTSVAGSYVEVSRLILGSAIVTDGIDVNAEFTFDNQTVNRLDPYHSKPTWKISLSGFKDAQFWNEWGDTLRSISKKIGFLFVPDLTSSYVQQQTIFGYVTAIPKATLISTDYTTVEMVVQSLL